MTPVPTSANALEEYLEAGVRGDGVRGRRLVLDLLDGGVPFPDLVRFLADAQREVGQRWKAARYGVAEEHLVSGVTQKALDALASTVVTPVGGPQVVMACAEGDWHSLPGQMMAELLRDGGVGVSFLGASTPSSHVGFLLEQRQVDALVVSCSIPMYYTGVARLADAAHAAGVPVLAGGRALGSDATKAEALGADAWAPDAATAVTVLRAWVERSPEVDAAPVVLERAALALEAAVDEVAALAMGDLQATLPAMASYTSQQRARTLEDLRFIVRFLAASRLVRDPGVFAEFTAWLIEVLEHRRVPRQAVFAGYQALAPHVAAVDAGAAELLTDTTVGVAPVST